MKKMRILIIAGPNGSGKSTLIRRIQGDPTYHFPENYINADDIARDLASEMPDLTEREKFAFHRAEELRQEYFAKRESFAFETVMSHPSKLIFLRQLREVGYEVVFYFVCTSNPAFNVERVRERILAGGHSVPEDRIVARYHRTLSLLPCAVEIANRAFVFDSTTRPPELRVTLTDGAPDIVTPGVPQWLQDGLLTPLRERAGNRQDIAEWALPRAVEMPDEQKSEWEGVIVKALPGYCVQEATGGRLIRHDCRLLKSAPSEGDRVRVSYVDGWADVVAM